VQHGSYKIDTAAADCPPTLPPRPYGNAAMILVQACKSLGYVGEGRREQQLSQATTQYTHTHTHTRAALVIIADVMRERKRHYKGVYERERETGQEMLGQRVIKTGQLFLGHEGLSLKRWTIDRRPH